MLAPPSPKTAEDEKKPRRQGPPVRRVGHTAEDALALSAKEFGLHMSLRSGVQLFEDSQEEASTFESLRFQADVNSETTNGTLLVDQPAHHGNIRLWIELLELRERLDGSTGVLDVWHGMRRRLVDLPTQGEEADILWPTFVQVATSEKKWTSGAMIYKLFDHAMDLKERTGRHYMQLHRCIVGGYFRINADAAAKLWHRKLTDAGFAPHDALKRVAPDVVRTIVVDHGTKKLKTFKEMYIVGTEHDLYDTIVGEALKLEAPALALRWHQILLKHDDAPSAEMFARSEVQRLFELDKDASLPMKHIRRKQSALPSGSDRPEYPSITRASMSSLIGDVHGIKPKEISDSFVAKMFATRAFSLDLVIRGLSFFSIGRLGPLAMREMAVRAGSPVDLCNKLADLKAMGIRTNASAYCRLIQTLANEGQTQLYQALLASDQHPEAYEDTKTQEALLTSFLESGNWMQVHITLLCLSFAGSEQHAEAWNCVVQHHLRERQYRLAARTIQHLQTQKAPLTFTTMTYLHRYLLPVRRRGKHAVESQRQDRPPFDALDFVTNAAMYTDELSRSVGPRVWRELLKRYGMMHRWSEFARLVVWLADKYSAPRFRLPHNGDPGSIRLRSFNPLRFIFDRQMRQAIFAWGFRSAAVRNEIQPGLISAHQADRNVEQFPTSSAEPWAQGLVLLQHLNSRGVSIPRGEVRHAFRLRMWILFGPAHSTLAINEMTRRNNQLSLTHYIRTTNSIWRDGNLIDIDPALLEDNDPSNESQLLLEFFGAYGHTGYSEQTHEYVDVRAWVRSLGSSPNSLYRGRTASQRHGVWQSSPFRITTPQKPAKLRARSASLAHRNKVSPPQHRRPSARSASSRPPPNRTSTRERA